jgi:hypothetical protein
MPGEGTVLFFVLAGRGLGRVAHNRLESFAEFVGNEKLSSPQGSTPVDRRATAGEGAKCGELLRALEAKQRAHFRHIVNYHMR